VKNTRWIVFSATQSNEVLVIKLIQIRVGSISLIKYYVFLIDRYKIL
jgi:hypothetical protein